MFSPFKDVFVHYRVTNMTWTPDHVMFSAKASFAAQQVMFNFDFMTVYYTSSVNFANFFCEFRVQRLEEKMDVEMTWVDLHSI